MPPTRTALLVAVAAVAVLVAACGGNDDTAASRVDRTVKVEMIDNAFRPPTIDVRRGETVRFVFDNTGNVAHDAFIGDAMAQADHEQEMRDADGMHHGGDDEGITMDAGTSGALIHTFGDEGAVEIGCHQPGHYQAGMRLTVKVT
jgi:uncharacterized cupredoxin-like copper-binding protein